MLYKQYLSKDLNGKILPKNTGGKIVQMSVQSRPETWVKIKEDNIENKYYIGDVGILEWDSISINAHTTNEEKFDTIITVEYVNSAGQVESFDGALIDILYDTSKEEDLNLE